MVPHEGGRPKRSQDESVLGRLGLDRNQSSRWQEEATVPEETFVEWIGDMLAFGYKTYEELTVQMEGEYKRKLKSLQNYRYVAAKIQRSLRRETLPSEFRKRQLRRPWCPG